MDDVLVVLQVVMAVAQLYWHLAPTHEVSGVTKSLVRLLRSHRSVSRSDLRSALKAHRYFQPVLPQLP